MGKSAIFLFLLLYAATILVAWLLLRDPWAELPVLLEVSGTGLTIVTLLLVANIKKELIAKSRLPDLRTRMRSLIGELAERLSDFGADPNPVRDSFAQIRGVLVSMETKVGGAELKMIRASRKEIQNFGSRGLFASRQDLTEADARRIYQDLLTIEESIQQLVSDMQRT